MTLDINSFANPNFKALIANHTEYQFLLAKYYKVTQKKQDSDCLLKSVSELRMRY